jgi:hypothetical protein
MLLHGLFEALGWIAALAAFWWTKRRYFQHAALPMAGGAADAGQRRKSAGAAADPARSGGLGRLGSSAGFGRQVLREALRIDVRAADQHADALAREAFAQRPA